VSDVIQSLFISEVLAPSDELWLLSPWISDIPVIDNSAGAFSSLLPARPVGAITLTDALIHLGGQGAQIYVIVRKDSRNLLVSNKLRTAQISGDLSILVIEQDNLHEKALLSSRFLLQGSMNFTHFGREVNEEALVLDSTSDSIARARLDYHRRFAPL
jgi:hypothetical protein